MAPSVQPPTQSLVEAKRGSMASRDMATKLSPLRTPTEGLESSALWSFAIQDSYRGVSFLTDLTPARLNFSLSITKTMFFNLRLMLHNIMDNSLTCLLALA